MQWRWPTYPKAEFNRCDEQTKRRNQRGAQQGMGAPAFKDQGNDEGECNGALAKDHKVSAGGAKPVQDCRWKDRRGGRKRGGRGGPGGAW